MLATGAVIIAILSIVVAWMLSLQYPAQSSFSSKHVPKLAKDKTFVVTGANSGIGLAAVRHLVEAGTADTIIMGCRSLLKCDRAKSEIQFFRDVTPTAPVKTRLRCLELDLQNLESIRKFAQGVQTVLAQSIREHNNDDNNEEEEDTTTIAPPLDVLINNAGIFGENNSYKGNADEDILSWNNETGAEMHMHVNHLGHFLLTSLLMDNLKASKYNGTVVSVSSLVAMLPALNVHDIQLQSWKKSSTSSPWYVPKLPPVIQSAWAYGASKRANLLFTYELQKRHAEIRSMASHPGATNTNLFLTGWDFFPKAVGEFVAEYIGSTFMMTPEEGGMTTLKAALDPTLPDCAFVGPKWYTHGIPTLLGVVTQPFDPLLSVIWPVKGDEGDVFWKNSEKLLGMTF